MFVILVFFFFSSRRRHTRCLSDWSSDVCSSDLIYFSAVTPDLYKPMYSAKVVAFFDKLMDQQFANKPFMRHYLDYYFDLYWDLHIGVSGDAFPFEVRQIGEAFNTVLAYRNPLLPVPHDNYLVVRERLDLLKSWIDDRLADIESGKTKN